MVDTTTLTMPRVNSAAPKMGRRCLSVVPVVGSAVAPSADERYQECAENPDPYGHVGPLKIHVEHLLDKYADYGNPNSNGYGDA